MGLPEWMLTVDSRKTRTLHGGTCIQFLLHFKGRSTTVHTNLCVEVWMLQFFFSKGSEARRFAYNLHLSHLKLFFTERCGIFIIEGKKNNFW